MIKKMIIKLVLSFFSLIAQDNFLNGINAEDFILDRIEAPSVEDTIGISNDRTFFYQSGNITVNRDGKLQAEARTKGGFGDGIWIIDLMSYEEKQIDTRGVKPKWSLDGQRIAYIKQKVRVDEFWKGHQLYGEYELWIYNLNTESKQKMTSNMAVGEFVWGPNGKIIAFEYDSTGGEEKRPFILGILDIETKEIIAIDKGSPYHEINFSLSPDGRMIAYCRPLGWELKSEWWVTDGEIFIANIDGSGKTQITETKAVEAMVKWSKDGKSLIVEQHGSEPDDLSMPPYVKIILRKK